MGSSSNWESESSTEAYGVVHQAGTLRLALSQDFSLAPRKQDRHPTAEHVPPVPTQESLYGACEDLLRRLSPTLSSEEPKLPKDVLGAAVAKSF